MTSRQLLHSGFFFLANALHENNLNTLLLWKKEHDFFPAKSYSLVVAAVDCHPVLSVVLAENGTNNVCFSNMKLLITRLEHYERSLL